jgi:hypothetical protein
MKPRRRSSRPRRAWASSGTQFSPLKNGQQCKSAFNGVNSARCLLKDHTSIHEEFGNTPTTAPFFLQNGNVIYVKIVIKKHVFDWLS